MNIVNKAREFAKDRHDGQYRKDDRIYFVHPESVAKKVAQYKTSKYLDEITAAAYLHDVLEDTETTYYELVKEFGFGVASLVLEVTTNKDMKNVIGKEKYLSFKLKHMTNWALVIKLCDRLDNMEDLNLPYIEQSFRDKYTAETMYIINYIGTNRELTNTHQAIITDIQKQLAKLKAGG